MRVERQAFNTGKLVAWLDAALHPKESSEIKISPETNKIVQQVLEKIEHASLRKY